MIESDIRGNINAECETPMCHGSECEMHHPECTCDACCQPTDSICEDNRDQCEETHPTSGGKKMKNRLMPILANSVVVLAVIANSGLVSNARSLDRTVDLNTGVVEQVIFDIVDDNVIDNEEISSEVEPIEAVADIHAIQDLDTARTINV